MEKKYRIKVIESIWARTNNFRNNVIVADYIGRGNSAGECIRDAQNQAETDWKTTFLDLWIASRKDAKKDSSFSTTCLEFEILERY